MKIQTAKKKIIAWTNFKSFPEKKNGKKYHCGKSKNPNYVHRLLNTPEEKIPHTFSGKKMNDSEPVYLFN